jgi:hypothetical protein
MSTELEQRVRASLHRKAAQPDLASPDPYTRFLAAQRQHRKTRRTRSIAAAGLITTVLVAGGSAILPVPWQDQSVPVDTATGPSLLLVGPVRGSLARDTAWLTGLRELAAKDPVRDGWTVRGPGSVHVVFAGEAWDQRKSLVAVTERQDGHSRTRLRWYSGPTGASPDQLALDGDQDLSGATATSEVIDAATGRFLVIGPASSKFRISAGPGYGADGRIRHNWRPIGSNGIAEGANPATASGPAAQIQVLVGGRVISQVELPRDGGQAGAFDRLIQAAGSAGSGAGAPLPVDLLTRFTGLAFDDARLDPATAQLTIAWAGSERGRPAALLKLTAPGGGQLYYAFRDLGPAADGGQVTRNDLRLLTPADADRTRPITWRLRTDGQDGASQDIAVVAPPGTASADVVAGGQLTSLDLDGSGFGMSTAPLGAPVTVRAFRADGSLIGQSPVPALEANSSGLPGASPETRLAG